MRETSATATEVYGPPEMFGNCGANGDGPLMVAWEVRNHLHLSGPVAQTWLVFYGGYGPLAVRTEGTDATWETLEAATRATIASRLPRGYQPC